MNRCRIGVGTSNEMKVKASVKAMRLLCGSVEAIPIPVEGLKPQPVGFRELLRGALVRAATALERASADYGVGVEAGPVLVEGVPVELQVAAIVDREGCVSIGFSQGFMLPSVWTDRVLEGVELGDIASKELKRPGIGVRQGLIAYLTSGLISRGDLTFDALVMALVPRLNPQLYKLPRLDELLARLG